MQLTPNVEKQQSLEKQTSKNQEESKAHVPHNMLTEKVGLLATIEEGVKEMLSKNGGKGAESDRSASKSKEPSLAELGAISPSDVPNAKALSQTQSLRRN